MRRSVLLHRLVKSYTEGMAYQSAIANAANASVVISSRVAENVAAQIDKLAAQWGLDRGNAIREILETAVLSPGVQRSVRSHLLPGVLPNVRRYKVLRGGTIKHFDGYSYIDRRYEEGQVLDSHGFPDNYVRSLHMRPAIDGPRILLEALPD